MTGVQTCALPISPIVPGVLPIVNFERTRQMAESCKAALPHWLVDLFADLEEDSEVRFPVAVSIAVELCRYLMGRGVEEFHIYTLNRADLTAALCRLLRNDARALYNYIADSSDERRGGKEGAM